MDVQKMAEVGTMFHDVELITLAMKKYGKMASECIVADDKSEEGYNTYIPPANQLKLLDSSITIAGEYIIRAQEKYGRVVTKADAPQIIALLRNYGMVTRGTADELAEYLGLR